MLPRVLLVNPPVHDFTAYDFWLKPYGLLRVAGRMRGRAKLRLFDFLDRLHPTMGPVPNDRWGRGPFRRETLPRPTALSGIKRQFHRFGLPQSLFRETLLKEEPYDIALIQTVMTYWYTGVREVIDDIRALSPKTRIVVGGVYATLCPEHARALGPDLVIEGSDLQPLWAFLDLTPKQDAVPAWETYPKLSTGVLKLTEGCPFRCTYCSVPQIYPTFSGRIEQTLAEFDCLYQLGVRRAAFYDDALLFKREQLLFPFLEEVRRRSNDMELHTPNALNARFITLEVAHYLVAAGFKTFHLGFESNAYDWQKKTGGKVYSDELTTAVAYLREAGAEPSQLTAYLIVSHPQSDTQDVETSMRFAHSLGLRLMLSEFSPIPGTPDGEICRRWVDLDEPLWHNKTAFPYAFLGSEAIQQLKSLGRDLNLALPAVS